MNELIERYMFMRTRGIMNIGSTCYINTAVQCLTYCLPFLDLVLSSEKGGLMGELKEFIRFFCVDQKEPLSPHRFIKALSASMEKNIHIHMQNDIQEFISLLLDKIHECIRVGIEDTMTQMPCSLDDMENKHRIFHAKARSIWLRDHRYSYSPLLDMFYGQQINQIRCETCGNNQHIFETICSLMVPLCDTHAHPNHLDELIGTTIKNEVVEDRVCDFCKQRSRGLSVKRFYRLPNVLMVNVKRFDISMSVVRAPIIVPTSIDLSDACLDKSRPQRFDLRAIACHIGGISSGHYYALCKHPNGKWLIIDDDIVRVIDDFKKLPSEHFYTLFYVKY